MTSFPAGIGAKANTLIAGTDQIVKNYFLGLPEGELSTVLAQYGRRYGASAGS